MTKEESMTISELGHKLREMYENAPDGDSVVMIHLFGIKFGPQLRDCGASARDLAIAAGIPESYRTEINKGINLSKYVQVVSMPATAR